MHAKLLEDIGLTKGEIKVYLALLNLGSSTSGPLIIKSNVSRSKVYEILERLKEKGLVSEIIQDNTRFFHAFSPLKILDYISNKKETLTQQAEDFKQIIPELIAQQHTPADKEHVKTYLGWESVKTFYTEMVDHLGHDEYLGITFSNDARQNKSLILLFHKFHQQRAHHGGKAKILCTPTSTLNKNLTSDKTYELRKTPLLLPNDLGIFKDTIAFFRWGKTPKVFAITSKATTDQYRQFFYSIWKTAQKI